MTTQNKDDFVHDQLKQMLLVFPVKKIKTMRGPKTVSHPYTKRLLEALDAVYPAKITDDPTEEAKEQFNSWWCSLELGRKPRREIRTFLLSAGTHPGFIKNIHDVPLEGFDLRCVKGIDEAQIQVLWQSFKKEGKACGEAACASTDVGGDSSNLRILHFRALVRELNEIQASVHDGMLTMEHAIAFCGFDDLKAAHCSRVRLLKVSGFKHMTALQDNFQKTKERNTRFKRIKTQLDGNMSFKSVQYAKEMQRIEAQSFHEITNIQACDQLVLVRIIQESPNPGPCYRIIFNLLKIHQKRSKILFLNSRVDTKWTNLTVFERFVLSSPWRKELAQDVMIRYEPYVMKRSSYPDKHRKILSHGVATMLEFIIAHTNESFSLKLNGIDPLKWFLRSCTIDMINEVIVKFAESRKVKNELVKSSRDGHHAAFWVTIMIRFFRKGVNHIIPCGEDVLKLNKSSLLNKVENMRVPADEMKRRTYTDEEIASMQACLTDDPMGSLIVTLLQEVGLRRGVLTYMRYDHLVSRDHVPRTTCTVPEKGKTVRQFVTSPNLQKRIAVYVNHLRNHHTIDDPSKFFMFNMNDPLNPPPESMIGRFLHETATKACLSIRVHAHAFRHTLVGKLMKAGNDISTVSKFMGHKSTDTTAKFYWLTDIKTLSDNINNPFMATYHTKEEEKAAYIEENELQRKKVDVSLRIIHSYNMLLSECIKNYPQSEGLVQFKKRVFEDLPDLEQLLKNIAASISDSTSTSSSLD